jgi:hypothetical protein
MCTGSGSLWGCGVTFDLMHAGCVEAEWVNAKTFAYQRDEVGVHLLTSKRIVCAN